MKKLYDGMQRFCAAHPRFGIPNLMRVIVIGNVAVYVLMLLTMRADANALSFLYLDGSKVLRGEIWRIVTFIFVPASSSPFWLAISLYFYYWIGSTLERQWGTAKFNLYYISGALLTVLGVVLASLITGNPYLTAAGTGYVNLSMFFAFATLYPNLQFLLFFIIPVKAKLLERGGDRRLFRLAGLFQCFQHHSVLSCFPSGASAAGVCSASEAAACPSA